MPATAASAVPERPVSADIVEARDARVRAHLKRGQATFEQLLATVHLAEPHLTESECRLALSRSLSRLKMKTREVVDRGNDVWELIA